MLDSSSARLIHVFVVLSIRYSNIIMSTSIVPHELNCMYMYMYIYTH